MSKPLVCTVILNWNRLDLTKLCVESVKKQTFETSIIVVDNGSTDGSVEWLTQDPSVHLISNSTNLGFARAINQGFSYAINDAGCDYVVSLNNDAVILQDWLEELISYMEQNPRCGFAQGASMQFDNKDMFDSSGIYLEQGFIPNQRALDKEDPCLDVPVVGPNAAGAIYRASMLKTVAYKDGKYFDDRFFAYVEDVDLNLRCTMRGFNFGYAPSAKLYHIGSATGSKTPRKKMFWGARNLVWLVYKNATPGILKLTYRKILRSHLANLQYLHRNQKKNVLPYLTGLLVGIITVPFFITSRHQNMKARTLTDEKTFSLLVPSNPPLSNPFKRRSNLIK